MKKELKYIILIILSSLLSAIAVQGFVEPAHLYPAGFLGLSVFISNILSSFLHMNLSFNLIYLILNVLSTFLVLQVAGKKLIIYSVLQYSLVSLFISIIPKFMLVDDFMLLSIFGGIIAGISCWLALDANASSGGTDFIAIFFSTKLNKNCWTEVMILNIMILTLAGVFFGWQDSFYSMIYQFMVTAVINKLYNRYNLVSLHIITDKQDEVENLIFKTTNHTATKIDASGLYSKEQKSVLYLVCNLYESQKISSGILSIDPNAFITETKISKVNGNYHQEKLQ